MKPSVTKENYQEFKSMYNDAVDNGRDQFTWQGACVITGWAKYLILHVETNLKW